jgi:lysophospholipase L1-like esterase
VTALCSPLATAPAHAAADTPAPVVRVMPLGDSITVGVGSSTGAGYRLPLWQRSTAQHRYTLHLVGSQRGGDFAEPWHEGHSGWMINDIAAQVDGWLAAQQPDVVLLHIGINDLDRSPDKEHAPDRLAALVDRIFADRPSVHLLYQGLLPTTAGLEDQVEQFNRQAAALVPLERQHGHDLRYVAPPELTPAEWFDRLHPDDRGYDRMAAAFYQGLEGDLSGQNLDGGTGGQAPASDPSGQNLASEPSGGPLMAHGCP